METKTLTPNRKVETKQISYRKMAEFLLNLQVELQLMAECQDNRKKPISATTFTDANTLMFHFEDADFALSLDLIKKGGEA